VPVHRSVLETLIERGLAAAEAEEQERRFANERRARQQREAEQLRQRQEAPERAARLEMNQERCEVIGEVVAEVRSQLRTEFAEQLGQLRAELVKQRGIDDGAVSPIVRKIRDNTA
jgi:hypothetical protein